MSYVAAGSGPRENVPSEAVVAVYVIPAPGSDACTVAPAIPSWVLPSTTEPWKDPAAGGGAPTKVMTAESCSVPYMLGTSACTTVCPATPGPLSLPVASIGADGFELLQWTYNCVTGVWLALMPEMLNWSVVSALTVSTLGETDTATVLSPGPMYVTEKSTGVAGAERESASD